MSGFVRPIRDDDVEVAGLSEQYDLYYTYIVLNNEYYGIPVRYSSTYKFAKYNEAANTWSIGDGGISDYTSGVGHGDIFGNKAYMWAINSSESKSYFLSFDGTTFTKEANQPPSDYFHYTVNFNNVFHFFMPGRHGSEPAYKQHYTWDGTTLTTKNDLPFGVSYRTYFVIYKNHLCLFTDSYFLIWDENTDTWDVHNTNIASDTICGVYVKDGLLYLIQCTNPGTASNSTMYVYDDINDSWSVVRTCPPAYIASYYNGKVHLVQTHKQYILADEKEITKVRKGWLQAIDKNKFIKVTDVVAVSPPIDCRWPKAVIYNNKIHILSTSANSTDKMYHYSYDGLNWIEESTLPYRPYEASYVVYHDKIHMISTRSDDERGHSHYSWDGTSWTQESTIPYYFGSCRNATVVYNDKIYIVGGVSNDTGSYLSSWDGITWNQEVVLPEYPTYYASAVVYDGKIHILGSYNFLDHHYAWDGTNWTSYPNMSFNNYGGSSFVYHDKIHVIYTNDHYSWDGYGWNKVSDLPYNDYGSTVVVYNDIIHMIGGGSSSESVRNHYVFNRIDKIWGTDIEIKEPIQPSNISINDTIVYGTSKKRIRKGWVGELNKEPKLVLQNIPIIDHARELGYNLPNSLLGNDGCYYRIGAVSYDGRIHVLGGKNNVHYSFSVTYNNDGDPIVLDCIKESPIPYEFRGDTIAVLDGEIHIFGSAYLSQYSKYHYAYNGVSWRQISDSSTMPNINSNYCVTVSTLTRVYIFYHTDIYIYNSSGSWTKYTNVLPFYVDNANHYGHQGAVYDPDNGRIILVDDYNMNSVRFYSLPLSSSSATLIKTISNEQFLHPLYVDTDVVPNGGEDIVYVLGGSTTCTLPYENVFRMIEDQGSWIEDYTLPYELYDGSAVVYNGKIHILGGINEYTRHYSSRDGLTWTQESTLPYNFSNGSAVVYNGKIHIMGGNSGYDNHYSWNGTSWTQESTLPYSFTNGSAVVYNNKIHILGGSIKHYSWNGTSWTQESTLPYYFIYGSAVVYNNNIHILGGGSDVYTYHYSWGGSSWTKEPTLPYQFYQGSAVVYNDKIHILGGGSSDGSAVHYSYSSTSHSWTHETALPYGISHGCSVVAVAPQEKFIIGWTTGSANLSSTGLAAFPTSKANLSSYQAWSWSGTVYGPTNNYKPAVTLTHNERIYMLNVDMNDTVMTIADLSLYSRTDYSAIFNQHDDNVLGMINSNGLSYNNYKLYTYGGEYSYNGSTVLKNTLYIFEYDIDRRRWYRKQSSTIVPASIPGTYSINLNNSKNISVIYNNELVIFTNATVTREINNVLTNVEAFIKIIYDTETNNYEMSYISSYSINFDITYGAFSYNNCIYLLGGLVVESHEWSNYLMKLDTTTNTWSTCGRLWDWQNNSWSSSPVRVPQNTSKFAYAVIDDHLHMMYVKDSVSYHKIFNLVTETNDLYGDHPIVEPLFDGTSIPNNFAGKCFASSQFIFIVCIENNSLYRIYYLDDDEWKPISTYLVDLPLDPIKVITLHETEALVQNIEIITNKVEDGLTAQYETRLDEYFN